MNTRFTATIALFAFGLACEPVSPACGQGDQPKKVSPADTTPKWEKDIVQHLEAFRVLYKDDAVGAFVPELMQWQTGTLKGKKSRIAQLEAALKDYPASPFVGNTALLLARARYFNAAADAEKAINDLYDVIKKYPDEHWIADDQPLRECIAGTALHRGKAELTELLQSERRATARSILNSEVFPYLEYASKHPNLVGDEAKIWISWIIVHAPLERRYQEAESLLRGIVAKQKDRGRTQADLKAAKQLQVELIATALPRSERTAHELLIELLKKQGKTKEAAAEAAAYARLHQGHRSVATPPAGKKASKAPKVGDSMTNTISMKLMYVPSGKFVMGSPAGEKMRGNPSGAEDKVNDETQREVEITKGFYLGKYEVTQEEYAEMMGKYPSVFKGKKLPVETVSWEEAREFCQKLSAKEGKTYRLPTEAEWEYACRAGTTTAFHFGETISLDQVNYNGMYAPLGGRINDERRKTTAVGSFASNAWGLHDMHGNVWEWCEDYYKQDFHKKSPLRDPQGPATGLNRVIRGGAWGDFAYACRSATRPWEGPTNRSHYVGFRVALSSDK